MRRVRRLLTVAPAVLTVLAVAACGSSVTRGAGSSPVASALSYFPSASPLVATIATDPHGASARQLRSAQSRVPAIGLAKTALFNELAKTGVDYNRDVRPLFGNPMAIGVASTTLTGQHPPFLLAWQTRDRVALKRLVAKLPGLTPDGTADGATISTVHGLGALAVDGSRVLLSDRPAEIRAALDRHAAGSGFSAAQYAHDTGGVATGGAVTIVGNLTDTLAQPRAAQARKVPWVAALRGYGATVSATGTRVSVRFHLDTTGRALTAAQLPIAAGPAAPGLAGVLPVAAGLRDPAQLWQFVIAAERAISPGSYAALVREERRARAYDGFDVERFVAMLSGDLQLTSDGHTTIACVPLSDPAVARAMFTRLMRRPPPTGPHGSGAPAHITSLGGGLYRVRESGSGSVVVGVLGNQFVVGRASPAEVRAYARTRSTAAAGPTGALAFRVDVANLVKLSETHRTSSTERAVLAMLGDVTGSVDGSTSGLTGIAELAIR